MIFVFTTIVVNFILLTDKQAGEGQFSGINALITTQEGVKWRMDISGWNHQIKPAKVGFGGDK